MSSCRRADKSVRAVICILQARTWLYASKVGLVRHQGIDHGEITASGHADRSVRTTSSRYAARRSLAKRGASITGGRTSSGIAADTSTITAIKCSAWE